MKNRIIKNTAWGTAELAVTLTVGLILPRIFILGMSREKYGLFLTLTLFSTYGILTMLDFGMGGAVTTFVARYHHTDPQRLRRLWTFAVVYFSATALLAMGVGLAIIRWYDAGISSRLAGLAISRVVLVPTILMVGVTFLSYLSDAVLFGFNDYGYVKRVTIVQSVLRVALVVLAVRYLGGFELIMWLMAALAVVRFLLLMSYLLTRYSEFTVFCRFSREDLREWFGYSVIILGSSLTGFIFNSFNRVLISLALPIAAMADFDIASKPQTLVRGMLSALLSAILPASAHYQAAGQEGKLREIFLRGAAWLHMMLFPPLVFITLMMRHFLYLWLGPAQVRLAPYAQGVLVYLYIYSFESSLLNMIMLGSGQAKRYLPVQIAASVLNLALSFLLVRRWGIGGLIFAYVCGHVLANVGFMWVGARALRLGTRFIFLGTLPEKLKLLIPPAALAYALSIAGVKMTIATFLLESAAYFLAIYTLYFIMMTQEERSFLRTVIGKLRDKFLPAAAAATGG